jgi:hypothetical protein
MNQSFDTQLQVVLRALNDVVAPALSNAEKHVLEQIHLSIATLGFIASRLPQARRYHRMELSLFMALAEETATIAQSDLAKICSDLRIIRETGEEVLTQPEAEIEDYQLISRRLREHIAQLSTAAADTPCKVRLHEAILSGSAGIQLQSRLWCMPFGFELNPDELPAPAWL